VAKVFISYRHTEPDLSLAGEIEHYLTSHGLTVFRDAQIKIGEEWSQLIDRHLSSSRFLVVLVSQASMQNRNVCEEVVRAHKRGLAILPLRLDLSEIPYRIASIIDPLQTRQLTDGAVGTVCNEILEIILRDEAPIGSPGTQLHLETGTVSLDSPFYVRRDVDDRIEERLRHTGKTILLRGAPQVGKSSLLVRAGFKAATFGRRVTRIDFQLMENEKRRSLTSLLRHLAFSIAADLKLEANPDEFWDDRRGSKASITKFVEEGVLKQNASPVVFCLDEVDNAFGAEYCDDFFAMLRVWHNERATSPIWNQLHLIITHSTDPTIWIRDLNKSPFNVGERHLLNDFSIDRIRDLCNRYNVRVGPEELMNLLGGHPFLIRKALFTIHSTRCGVSELIADVFADSSPFRDHLQLLLIPLLASSHLSEAMRQIISRGNCDSERAYQGLLGAGLIKGVSRDRVAPRCELYRTYFAKHL
jgi:AAA-like domain/TIR domain